MNLRNLLFVTVITGLVFGASSLPFGAGSAATEAFTEASAETATVAADRGVYLGA